MVENGESASGDALANFKLKITGNQFTLLAFGPGVKRIPIPRKNLVRILQRRRGHTTG